MAFEKYAEQKEVFYQGYDRNPLWGSIHNAIKAYARGTDNIVADYVPLDIFNVLAEGGPTGHVFNIVVIQYLISHLFNTGQSDRIEELYSGIIDSVVSKRRTASPFLIIINDIDTYHKGRNLFYKFLNLLEDNGYNGRSLAYSSYANGDLGKTRWGGNKVRNGNITYAYGNPPLGFEGAGLIIELR